MCTSYTASILDMHKTVMGVLDRWLCVPKICASVLDARNCDGFWNCGGMYRIYALGFWIHKNYDWVYSKHVWVLLHSSI